MAILNLPDLINHAAEHNYQLPTVNVQSLSVLKGIIAWAKRYDVPFIVTIDAAEIENGLMPSIEDQLRQEKVTSSIVAKKILNQKQAIAAIRRGCQALFLDTDCNEQMQIAQIANACGVKIENVGDFIEIDRFVELSVIIKQIGAVHTWQQLDSMLTNAVIQSLEQLDLKAKGMAIDAKTQSKPYTPVEHLIIYNSSVDDEQTQKAAKLGATVLDNIPGVRVTWRGESVKSDAKYRWCWLIRFANEAVIDSYRDHPEHVAYANEQFRPIAGDRVSIDYMLFSPENDA